MVEIRCRYGLQNCGQKDTTMLLRESPQEKGVQIWLSNNNKTISDAKKPSIVNRLEEEPAGAWWTLGDTVLLRGNRNEVMAVYNSVPKWEEGKPRLRKPAKVLEGNEGFFFDLLNIGWWSRKTGVQKAGITLTPIAVGLAISKGLDWW